MVLKIAVLRRNSRRELLATSRFFSYAETKKNKKENKINIYLFEVAYVFYSHFTASISLYPCASNILQMFAELGRLCGHESRSGSLHDVGW